MRLVLFFREDRLKAGVAVSSLNFVLTPFSVVISALFRRDMEFGKLALGGLAANFLYRGIDCACCHALHNLWRSIGRSCWKCYSYFSIDRHASKQPDFSLLSCPYPAGCR